MTDPRPARRYRFGAFEADATTGELRRQGIRIRLNAQPFQVLCLLLERPGELLTREEISRELWPDGTFVDYEHGVNSAVNRIRESLRDTASSPRFIETLARRGYRFVAPVERIALNPQSPSVPEAVSDSGSASALRTEQPAVVPEAEAVPEADAGFLSGVLASPHDLPRTSYHVVQTLFVLLQLMYVGFYVGALANLPEIEELFSPLPRETQIVGAIAITAAVLIIARAFLISAAFLHPPRAREKLLRMWPFLLLFDELWSLAPFLLMHHISVGLAVACMALLVYSPFAQRSLVLMGAGGGSRDLSATVR
jgi:DNA-binding winged helix-turn-helix (wHTH) protein